MTEKRLTEEEARNHTTHCPVCPDQDENYYAYSLAAEGPEMWLKFRCNNCDTQWTEVFLLYLIETEPEDGKEE